MNPAPLTNNLSETNIDAKSKLELKIGVGLAIFSLLGLLINFFD